MLFICIYIDTSNSKITEKYLGVHYLFLSCFLFVCVTYLMMSSTAVRRHLIERIRVGLRTRHNRYHPHAMVPSRTLSFTTNNINNDNTDTSNNSHGDDGGLDTKDEKKKSSAADGGGEETEWTMRSVFLEHEKDLFTDDYSFSLSTTEDTADRLRAELAAEVMRRKKKETENREEGEEK